MALGLGLGLSMQIIPGGDGVSPTLSNSGLSVITYDNNSFDVDFIKATDDVSAQSVLVYKLYTSSSANIGTVANAEANGTLQATGTDVNSLTASTGITAPNTYHFNVVVEDEAGNKTAYTANSIALPYTDTTPPTVGTSTLSTSSVLSTSFDVDFAKATDDYSAQNTLVYKLYTSTSNNVSTVSDATTNGTLQDTQTDVTQLSASGLTASTTYYFNVVVEDEAGNKTAYTSNSETTSTSTDITPPAYTTSGTLTAVTVTTSSITVGFDKCTDNVSPQSALVYKLYISISDPINTVEYAEANGTLKDTGTDVDQLTASGLNSATFYDVNVVVEDEAGNKTAYFSRLMTTGGGGSITYDSLGTATTVGYINGGPNTVTYTHTFGSSITDGTVLVMVACDYYLDASFTVDVGGVTASHVVSYWNWGGIEVFVATGLSGSSATVTITGPSGISDFGYDFTGWSVALTGVDQSTPTGNTATTEFQISGSVSVNSPSDGDYVFCAAHRYYRGTLSADISADEVAQGTFYIASIMNSVPYSAVLRQWSTGDPTSIGFTGTDAFNPHYKATSIILNAA